MKSNITLFTLIFLSPIFLFSQSTTWTGAISSDWHDASNWNNGVPTINTPVSIFASMNDPIISANAFAQQVNISSGSELTIQMSASLDVDKSLSTNSISTVILNGKITNLGDLRIYNAINNSSGLLINSNGEVDNHGTISIGELGTIDSYGLYNNGTVGNNLGAEIRIDDSNVGISNFDGTFVNDGDLIIGAMGPINNFGLFNRSNLTNNPSAEITISNAKTALSNAGTVSNYSKITIGDSGPIVSFGVANSSNFYNEPTGDIIIDDARTGMANDDGSFINNGDIKIGETITTDNFGLVNYSVFDNFGNILIFNVNDVAFRNRADAASTGFFTNKASGLIEIGSCKWGVVNEESLLNEGFITIGDGSSISLLAIENKASGNFHNLPCATIECNYLFSNISSTAFLNDGFFLFDSSTGSIAGDFINNGVLSDIQSTFPITAAGYVNNSVYIQPTIISDCQTSQTFTVLSFGSLIVEGIYLDASGTTPAGSYDQSTNTFTSFAPLGMQRLYVNFEDTAGGCFKIVPWDVNVTINSTITFTGNGDGTNWHDPLNWDLGVIPDRCHVVVIPASQNVIINAGTLGVGLRLCVDSNATFDMASTANLEIMF